jgi:hypothetical protein
MMQLRFSASPHYRISKKSIAELGARSRTHDAQSVIAREHGFDSWNAMREEVEGAHAVVRRGG